MDSGDADRVRTLLQEAFIEEFPGHAIRECFEEAVAAGRLKIVELFLRQGIPEDIVARGLLRAVEEHELAAVKLLLDQCSDEATRSGILVQAAVYGQSPVLDYLLDRGIPVNSRDARGWTCLMMASGAGNAQLTAELLDRGADVNIADRCGYTPLMDACLHGHAEVARLLLEAGARPNEESAYSAVYRTVYGVPENWFPPKMTALSWAALNGDEKVVKLLLRYGADPNFPDSCGWTPVMMAALQGHTRVMELLADAGANVHARTTHMRAGIFPRASTPLMIACHRDHVNTVAFLLERGADAHATNDFFATALMQAAAKGSGPGMGNDEAAAEMVRRLINAGAEVDARDDDKKTALIMAGRDNRAAVVDALIEGGADVHARSAEGHTALAYARACGHRNVAEVLEAHGAALPERYPASPPPPTGHAGFVAEKLSAVPVPAVGAVIAVLLAYCFSLWAGGSATFHTWAEQPIEGSLAVLANHLHWVCADPGRYAQGLGWFIAWWALAGVAVASVCSRMASGDASLLALRASSGRIAAFGLALSLLFGAVGLTGIVLKGQSLALHHGIRLGLVSMSVIIGLAFLVPFVRSLHLLGATIFGMFLLLIVLCSAYGLAWVIAEGGKGAECLAVFVVFGGLLIAWWYKTRMVNTTRRRVLILVITQALILAAMLYFLGTFFDLGFSGSVGCGLLELLMF